MSSASEHFQKGNHIGIVGEGNQWIFVGQVWMPPHRVLESASSGCGVDLLLNNDTATLPAFAAATILSWRGSAVGSSSENVCLVAASVRNALTSENYRFGGQVRSGRRVRVPYIEQSKVYRGVGGILRSG